MKTFEQFILDYEGKTVGYPNSSSFFGECLSLTKWHIKEVYGIDPPASGCNGARCYWSLFPNPLGTVLKKIPNTDDLIPKRGWIAVWNEKAGAGAGHIASVLEANINSFVSLDQNWNGRQAHRVTHTYDNVYGFLVPIKEDNNMPIETMTVEKAVFENLVSKASKYDEIVKAGFVTKTQYEQREKELLTDVKNLNEKLTTEVTNHGTTQQKLTECLNKPIVPVPQPTLKGTLNGFTKTYIKDGVTVCENYAVQP